MRDAIINLQFSTVERSYFCTFKFVMLFYNNRFNSELQVICKLRISRDEEIRLRNIYVNIYTVYIQYISLYYQICIKNLIFKGNFSISTKYYGREIL